MSGRVISLYFSPTGSSREIGGLVARQIAAKLGCAFQEINYTQPKGRETAVSLDKNDVLLLAFPVYSGRMPRILAGALRESLAGGGVKAIPIAVYGNRAFDDALVEAADILAERGCETVGAIAAIAQHTFDPAIGAGRPDAEDKKRLTEFGDRLAALLQSGSLPHPEIPGKRPYLEPKPLPPISPATSDACNYCGICAAACPAGVIDAEDEHKIRPGCILCAACVKYCPQKAKSLPPQFLEAVRGMLAKTAVERREPELFL